MILEVVREEVLEIETYRFHLDETADDERVLRLHSYVRQTRSTKRHKFREEEIWMHYEGRTRPFVPGDVWAEAMGELVKSLKTEHGGHIAPGFRVNIPGYST